MHCSVDVHLRSIETGMRGKVENVAFGHRVQPDIANTLVVQHHLGCLQIPIDDGLTCVPGTFCLERHLARYPHLRHLQMMDVCHFEILATCIECELRAIEVVIS